MKRAMLCLWLVGLFVPAASAALTPGQKMAAESLIKQFGAAEFDARQKAVEAIVVLGPDVAPLVRKALAETADNEVKLRCEMALKGLREKFGAAAVDGEKPAAPAGAVNYDASRVTLDVKDAPLSEVLEALAGQSGNAPVNAGNFADRKVTLSAKDVPYWQAFDQACEQARVVYQPAMWGQAAGLRDQKAQGPTVAAYAGPAVIWIDGAQRGVSDMKTAAFRTQLQNWQMPASRRWITLAARVCVEDRLRIAGYRIAWTAARTPDGQNVLPAPAAYVDQFRGMRYGSSYGGTPSIQIPDTEAGIKGPLAIEGKLRVEIPVGRREVRIEDVFSGVRKTAGDDAVTLADVSADRRAGMARVLFTLETDKDHAGVITYDMPAGYGFALIDPAGTTRPRVGGWSGNGKAVSIDFQNVPEIEGKWTLVLAYPERIESKDFAFTFKDVPLP